jgi:zinc protease
MLQRHIAPPFVKASLLELPTPIIVNLAHEVDLFILDGVKQNVCKIELILEGGKWFESKIGLASFTSALLEKGTFKKSSSEIAALFDYYGAHLEINAGYDFVSVSMVTVKDHLPTLLPLLQEILLMPSFPEKEWGIMRSIFLQNLKVNNEKTSVVASKLIRKNVFGEAHPYGASIVETDAEALTVSDFLDFYKARFRIKNIFVCGELNPSEVDFISTAFESLFPKSIIRQSLAESTSLALTQHIEKESVQSSIRLGKKSILKSHEDYGGLLLVNHLLGGFFGSRLMKNIREEKGLTYGIHSSVFSFQKDSLFVIEADVNKSNLSLALAEIKKEIGRLQTQLVSNEELILARNHFIGGLQNEIANPFSVAEKIKNIQLNSLGLDYYQRLIDNLETIDAEKVQSLAQKHLKEVEFFQVTVG